MNKRKISILIPLIIIASFVIYSWFNILFGPYIATWRHYAGLIGFLILIFLYFTSFIKVTIATGIFLLFATFNLLAITLTISTSWMTIFSIPTPEVQLLSLGIFIVYFVLNIDSLYNIYMDYKEEKALKKIKP